jgi:hypothetical protein
MLGVDGQRRPEVGPVQGTVAAVSRSATHTSSKSNGKSIRILAGLGVDRRRAHLGETVRHRSRVRQDPTRLNLRQVLLIRAELHDELRAAGFRASAGQMGENVTTRGTDLLGLPPGTTLRLGEAASVEVTGPRSPCRQLDSLQRGLMKAVLDRDERDNLVRKAGIMGPVLAGGELPPEDEIRVLLPPGLRRPLDKISRASSDPPAAPA